MNAHFFAIRQDAQRVIAAEVSPETAAALVAEARPLLLGTKADLVRLAYQQDKILVVFSGRHSQLLDAASSLTRKKQDSLAPAVRVAGRRAGVTSTERRPAREAAAPVPATWSVRPANVEAA